MAQERTALEILNAAEDELGLARSSSVASPNIPTRQRLAFLNATLEECMSDGDWSGIEKEAIIEFGAPTVIPGDLVAGSATITVASTAFLVTPSAWLVSGEGLQTNTRVLSAPSATTILLSKTAEATASAVELTFVQDTFAFPSDYGHWLPQTHWDAGLMWSMIGPTSSQFDAFQRNGIVGPFPRRQFRRQGALPTAFRIFPPPTATGAYPGTLSFRYISNEPVLAEDGSTKRFVTANGDRTSIPDRLLILGLKWRWQQSKGFDFGPLQEEYYNVFDLRVSEDKGQSIVPLDGRGEFGYPDRVGYNVPDGNFPGAQ